MRFALLAFIGLGSVISLLSGCAGSTDPAKTAAQQQAVSAQILANKNRKGALLLLRIYEPGLFADQPCFGGIRLRRLGSGVPDDKAEVVDLGGARRMFLPKETKAEGKKAGFLNNVPDANTYEDSFYPIASGRYVITKIRCQYGAPIVELEGGHDDDGLFSHVTPFAGASTITIGQGQIVDAGYAHFEGKRDEPTVVATEASATEREFMKKVIPEVYPAITFKKFGE
ncbi:hypothetical protein [Rhizobium sp. NXC24]|uniref:hypothetical protein n=1 Tax=Rhizobium sp. NXC24 TaxID=2048897 RepID=UPI000CDF3FF8|nr:hypothetical protein [Rhizobium sp. NXC24]AVA26072.1 hypothetical protein NXC24_PC01645 [Rhizobium sp. NXC24]